MVIAKGLIFKSLLGIATSGVVIVPIVLTKLSNKKTEEDSDVENGKSEEGSNGIISGSNQGVNDVSSSQTTVNTGDQQISSSGSDVSTSTPVKPEEVDALGIPQSCKTSCQLTADQLKNLKFEPKTAGASLTVEGLTDNNNTVTLEVEDKQNDLTNYPKGKKYTLKTTTGTVKIKGVKDGDIAIEKNKDVVIREKQSGGLLEKAPEEVDTLGIPKSCKSEEAKNGKSQTCQLTQEQLGKIKFEPKNTSSSISVNGLTSGDKVTLTISDVSTSSTEKANYPKGKKYNFKTSTGKKTKITEAKDSDIEITDKGINFREKTTGGQLETALDVLGIPKSCATSTPCQLTKEQLGKIKFEPKSSSTVSVDGLTGNNTVELTVTSVAGDTNNYPKNKKYTLKATNDGVIIKNTQDGDIALEKGKSVDFREKSTDNKLERTEDSLGIPKSCKSEEAKNGKSQTCQLTAEQLGKIKFEPKNTSSSISVNGLTSGDKVTLTISDVSKNSEYPKGKKYNFKTSAQKTATITGTKENISITNSGIDFREKTTGGQLEKVPVVQKLQAATVDSLGLPEKCKANQITKSGSSPQTCELTAEDLKKVKFKTLNDTGTSVSGLNTTNNKIKLTISWDDDEDNYPDNKKYSFDNSSNNSDVKITKEEQEVTIAKKTESWFKNESGKLVLFKTKLKEEKENKMKDVKDELTKLGLSALIKLEIGDFKNDNKADFEQKTLKLDKDTMKLIQFSEFSGPPTDISDWNDENKFDLMLDYAEDSNSYPKNMKFSFKNNSGKDITIKSAGKSLKFSNNKWETFKVVNNELTRTTTG